jgi:hypothetical protein
MEIKISIDGIERTFIGEYEQLHNNDWDAYVRDLLDTVNDNNEKS